MNHKFKVGDVVRRNKKYINKSDSDPVINGTIEVIKISNISKHSEFFSYTRDDGYPYFSEYFDLVSNDDEENKMKIKFKIGDVVTRKKQWHDEFNVDPVINGKVYCVKIVKFTSDGKYFYINSTGEIYNCDYFELLQENKMKESYPSTKIMSLELLECMLMILNNKEIKREFPDVHEYCKAGYLKSRQILIDSLPIQF